MWFEDFRISEGNDFSNSESLCCSYASHQVSAQSDLRFGRKCRLKIFKMAADMAVIFGYRNRTILSVLNLDVTTMPPIKFRLNLTGFGSRYDFKMAVLSSGTTILAILNLYVAPMLLRKFQRNPTTVWKEMLFEESWR